MLPFGSIINSIEIMHEIENEYKIETVQNMTKFLQNKDYRLRKIENMYLLINIKYANYYDNPFLMSLNEIGKTIWLLLDEPKEVSAIAEDIASQLIDDVEISMIEKDVEEFLNIMIDKGCVDKIDV